MPDTEILGLWYPDGVDAVIPPGEYDDLIAAVEQTRHLIQHKVNTFADGDTTPSVLDESVFKTANTSPTTITAFDDGVEGQEIFILLDANTTLTDGGTLKLNGGLSGSADDTITLVKIGSNWYEKCRSTN